MAALLITVPTVAREICELQHFPASAKLDTWAQAVAGAVQGHAGVPLASLTLAEAARPTLDGTPHGIYFVWVKGKLVYIGSCKGRMFHERLAAHIEGSENGWFNSCVRAMARSKQWPSGDAAVRALLSEGAVAFFPVGQLALHGKEQRRALVQVENRLRGLLNPLNRLHGQVDDDQLEAAEEREGHALVAMQALAEADEDLGELEPVQTAAGVDVAGEVLFVKCTDSWGRARTDAERQASVLGDWTVSEARATGVHTVAGVAAGKVVAAWEVVSFECVGDRRLRFTPARKVTDLAALAQLIAGHERGWTWKYAAAPRASE